MKLSYKLNRAKNFKYKSQREDIVRDIERDLGLDYISLVGVEKKHNRGVQFEYTGGEE